MQNWKLRKMSYQELIGQLQAVRSMLYYYQRGKDYPGACRLCKVSREYHPKAKRFSACKNCLWKIIEGQNCHEFVVSKFGNLDYVRKYTGTERWHTLRKPMLRRWAKIIQGEMDNRTCGGLG